jgi:hypothetical protein
LLGAGYHEKAGPARGPIDLPFERRHQLRRVLNLVEHQGWTVVLQEQLRLRARILDVEARIEDDVVEVWKDVPKQRGLAHLPRPAHQHHRE